MAPQAPLDPSRVAGLPTFRLNLMPGGYLLMALGLIIVKWPLLLQAASMPRHALQHPLRGRHPGRDPLGLRVEALRADSRGQLGTNRLMALTFG